MSGFRWRTCSVAVSMYTYIRRIFLRVEKAPKVLREPRLATKDVRDAEFLTPVRSANEFFVMQIVGRRNR